jgi:hypothetical protein
MTPKFSKGKMSVSASATASTLENYNLETLHVPKKRRMGGVPHKSP